MGKGDPQPSPWRLVPILAIAAALAQALPPLETISSTALRIRTETLPESPTPRSPFGIQTGKRAKELAHLRHIAPHELALLVAALKPLAAGLQATGLQATGLQESLGRSPQPAQATAAWPGSGAGCPQPEQRRNGSRRSGKTLGPGVTGCGYQQNGQAHQAGPEPASRAIAPAR